jgi:hypothetical protein
VCGIANSPVDTVDFRMMALEGHRTLKTGVHTENQQAVKRDAVFGSCAVMCVSITIARGCGQVKYK